MAVREFGLKRCLRLDGREGGGSGLGLSERDAGDALSRSSQWPGGRRGPAKAAPQDRVPLTTGPSGHVIQRIHSCRRPLRIRHRSLEQWVRRDHWERKERIEAKSSNGRSRRRSTTPDRARAARNEQWLDQPGDRIESFTGTWRPRRATARWTSTRPTRAGAQTRHGAKLEAAIGVGGEASRLKTSNRSIRVQSARKK